MRRLFDVPPPASLHAGKGSDFARRLVPILGGEGEGKGVMAWRI